MKERINTNEGNKLTVTFLSESGFEREVIDDRDGDNFTVWIRDGITIYEDNHGAGEIEFNYATYIKGDGSFKGGFRIETDSQLENLYYALSGKELDNPRFIKDKMILKLGVPTGGGNIYLESEFTRNRIWSQKADGSIYEGTMLEKLNGIMYMRPKDSAIRYRIDTLPPVFGTLNHPEGLDTPLQDISHVLENFKINDGELFSDIKILPTEKGNDLKDLVDIMGPENIIFGARGIGKVNEEKEVTEFEVFSFDVIKLKR